ncbi:hypothetical protein AB1L05_08080 [Cytobacillus horneckiae]|uniref:hypothetical protein n=1 Tax=Cytobacillus horneckiae TaxID=549687 RepID=UPI0039A137FF
MILSRKIISASISGTLFTVLLGFIWTNPFGDNITSIQNYLFSVISVTPIYMMYSMPVIMIYGILTSIISDKIGEFISIKAKETNAEIFVSGALHIVFGLVLFWISIGASLLFFITDRLLKSRNKKYEWLEAIKSLAIPLLTWLILMGIVWGYD